MEKNTPAPWGIHWFRRDLRIPGNHALRENWKQTKGRTLGFFCFDSKFLSRPDFSHNRFSFFLKTLKALREDLQEQGGDLLVIDCLPAEAFPRLFSFCKSKEIPPPSLVTWGRDYEPFTRKRDSEIQQLLEQSGVRTLTERDHLLFEPHEVTKDSGAEEFYQIYSPFGRKWFDTLHSEKGQKRIAEQKSVNPYFEKSHRASDLFKMKWESLSKLSDFPFQDELQSFFEKNEKHVTIPVPQAGFFQAFSELMSFKDQVEDYKENRDIPSLKGTSRLSHFLKNGSLTTSQIIYALGLQKVEWKSDSGPTQFVKELAWREFYYSILYHRPDVETQSFLPQYRDLAWENNAAFFDRWKEGTTGFPIVDAGMRELLTTGWMHNRVRMIVASFLTKDLLIDWRWGENHFMKFLLDGDLASNNGGWQWAASTGCDPQPYFRVFNPWLQGAKFDPHGSYIKRFVPELEHAPAKALHAPDADRSRWNYPAPMVDHSIQRMKAIALYKRT